jgi:hypothetical protein
MIFHYHTAFSERTQVYSSADEMKTANGGPFASTDPAVVLAERIFSQNPKPTQVVVGRADGAPLMTRHLTPVGVTDTDFQVTVNDTDFNFLSVTATVSDITAGLEAALAQTAWAPTTAYVVGDHVSNLGNVYECTVAGTSDGSGGPSGQGSAIVDATVTWKFKGSTQDVLGTDATTHLILEKADAPGGSATAGDLYTLEVDRSLITQSDETPMPATSVEDDILSIRTDLDGNDDWYAMHMTLPGTTMVDDATSGAAQAIQQLVKVLVVDSADDDIPSGGSGNLGETLSAAGYTRTYLAYREQNHDYLAAGVAANILPLDPGSTTWKFQSVTGLAASNLTTTEQTNMLGNNVNIYVDFGRGTITCDGKSAEGEFMDVVRGTDFIRVRAQEDIFDLLRNEANAGRKVAFTNSGIAQVEAALYGVLKEAARQGVIVDDTDPDNPFTITSPDVTDVPTADKATRNLPDIEAQAILQGAIHSVEATITVAV